MNGVTQLQPATREPEAGRTGERERQVVVFHLAGEAYGVDIRFVREIIPVASITRLPNAPAFVEGVINLRGHVLPVLDLRKRFGLSSEVDPRRTRIMVAEVNAHTVGLVVDSVSEVLRVAESTVEPATGALVGVELRFVEGVAKLPDRLVILLDLEHLLGKSEARALDRVEVTVEKGEALAGEAQPPEGEVGPGASREPEGQGHGADPLSA